MAKSKDNQDKATGIEKFKFRDYKSSQYRRMGEKIFCTEQSELLLISKIVYEHTYFNVTVRSLEHCKHHLPSVLQIAKNEGWNYEIIK